MNNQIRFFDAKNVCQLLRDFGDNWHGLLLHNTILKMDAAHQLYRKKIKECGK